MYNEDQERSVVERLVEWARAQDTVRAVLLTSTRAAPNAAVDRFSDFDVVLYVTDSAALTGNAKWLESFGPLLVRFEDELEAGGARHSMRLALYEDGTRMDFTIAPVEQLERIVRSKSLPEGLDVGYCILLDKDGRAAALPPPTYKAYIPRRPSQQEFQALVEEFWWETTCVAKHLGRGDLLPARYSLEAVMKLDLLRRMLEWRVEIEHGWSLPSGSMGKGLKKYLDSATWPELERTFTGADIEENWDALFNTARLRLAYPQELDARVTDYLQRMRASHTATTA